MKTRQNGRSNHVEKFIRNMLYGLLLMLLWSMGGCVPKTITVKSTPQFNPAHIHTVAIQPLKALSTPQGSYHGSQAYLSNHGSAEHLRSFELTPAPAPGRVSTQTITVPTEAPTVITHMLVTTLSARPGITLIPPAMVTDTKNQLKASGHEGQPFASTQQLGQHVAADAILQGLVRIYREREGSRIGATPAAVGFEVQLIGTKTGAVLWSGNYYEEQKPLTEDIQGFLERGGAFVTAKELAQSGVDRMMQQLPIGTHLLP
ncbi:MAG: hypothetical protein GKS05_03480 [Nitrospirales bacterium]|nr:hypothetical protein [Nitrospirales bacterium]